MKLSNGGIFNYITDKKWCVPGANALTEKKIHNQLQQRDKCLNSIIVSIKLLEFFFFLIRVIHLSRDRWT